MSKLTDALQDGLQPLEHAESRLEQLFIERYLAGKGYTMHDLDTMAADAATELMIEASRHASLRLTEIESAATFLAEIEAEK